MEKLFHFIVVIIYNDCTKFSFDVHIGGERFEVVANLHMITRGTLMASSAKYAYAYNDKGFQECAFRKD